MIIESTPGRPAGRHAASRRSARAEMRRPIALAVAMHRTRAARSRSPTVEIVVAVAVATGVIAALQSITPGLGARQSSTCWRCSRSRSGAGELAALVTAVLSVLTLNYFFITPRHRLTIAHSQDVVELVVLLIVAVVVGRLAALAPPSAPPRPRAARGSPRRASARRRCWPRSPRRSSPATASSAQLESIGGRIAARDRRRAARGSRSSRCRRRSPARSRSGCASRSRTRVAVRVAATASWTAADLERIAEPLGRLIDVAVERERSPSARPRPRRRGAPTSPGRRSSTRSRTTCARR